MNTRERLLAIEKEMNSKYINREDVIRGLIITLLARGNIVLLGAPGTAKTDMVETLSNSINGKCFETLLTKTSSPEELVGPLDIKELEAGRYKRVTEGTLADCDIGYVDETFKGSSPTLNVLLPIMAQRKFRNGTSRPETIPLLMLVGASNELPEGGVEGPLSALWDRFEMRFVVNYIKDEGSFIRLLQLGRSDSPVSKVGVKDIIKAQEEVRAVSINPVIKTLATLWGRLTKEGFGMSDRKWRDSLRYMQANAWLDGREELCADDVLILKDIAWNTPEQAREVRSIIRKATESDLARAQDLYDSITEIYATLKEFSGVNSEDKRKFGATKFGRLTELFDKATRAKKMIQTSSNEYKRKGRTTAELEGYIKGLNSILAEVTSNLVPGGVGGDK